MNKKELKTENKITLEKFLRDYCEMDNNNIIEMLASLSHKELKLVCAEIYGVSLTSLPFECVTKENISCGEVIIVNDNYNNPAPYRNPKIKNYISLEKPATNIITDYDKAEIYEDIIDDIEENLTILDVDISSIGSFDIPKVKIIQR